MSYTWTLSRGPSPFLEPRDQALPMDQPDDQDGSRRIVGNVQRGDHHGGDGELRRASRRNGDAFSNAYEPFAGLDIIDVPMRSYCWRATKR